MIWTKTEITGLLLSIALVVFILELVRRRRLLEEYSLLWLIVGAFMIIMAFWKSGLDMVSHIIGIAYPPSTLFLFGLIFVIILLLHFSTVISRLTEQNKILAQKVAILEEKKSGDKA